MVGPWQTPVADCAVTANDFVGISGEAMAIGERTPLAMINAAASARMAVGEALTNIAAARIRRIGDVVLSANWMAAAGHAGEDARLFEAVQAIGLELCPQLGIAIPVGKDSMSMQTSWQADGDSKQVTAPVSAIVSAFAPVTDTGKSLTPQLRTDCADTCLLLIDLGCGRNRLGGSVFAQTYQEFGSDAPDVDVPQLLSDFFQAIQLLNETGYLLAYHDRADGGVFATVCEMAFAGRVGVNVELPGTGDNVLSTLFSEELGAVVQIRREHMTTIMQQFSAELRPHIHSLGELNDTHRVIFLADDHEMFNESLQILHRWWSQTSYHMQALRDNPQCAAEEFEHVQDMSDPGLSFDVRFDIADWRHGVPAVATTRPTVAVLREQGINGQVEMAAAFDRAGFDAVDVHMTDLIDRRVSLDQFVGLAACGGFSYGDVLGAGSGWAKSILFNDALRDAFSEYFARDDTFTLGVCNGCQMLAQLQTLIPGTDNWPQFIRNRSEQFEARLVMVEVLDSPSILMHDIIGSRVPIVVAHGEGRAEFPDAAARHAASAQQQVCLRYIDNMGDIASRYPLNPNGSHAGITGLTSRDGRVTIMMPHPERVFLARQYSWLDPEWSCGEGPWLRLFENARRWAGH